MDITDRFKCLNFTKLSCYNVFWPVTIGRVYRYIVYSQHNQACDYLTMSVGSKIRVYVNIVKEYCVKSDDKQLNQL